MKAPLERAPNVVAGPSATTPIGIPASTSAFTDGSGRAALLAGLLYAAGIGQPPPSSDDLTASTPVPELEALIDRLRACAPADRIDLRDDVLAFGADCIGPLKDLADEDGAFSASVASWLEVLAKRDPETKPAVIKALADIAAGIDGYIARDALVRLGAGHRVAKGEHTRPIVRSTAEMEVYARVIQAAREGRVVFYSDLETSRGHIGKYLLHISQAEAEAGHPPLTSIVISKTTGRPGDAASFTQSSRSAANIGTRPSSV